MSAQRDNYADSFLAQLGTNRTDGNPQLSQDVQNDMRQAYMTRAASTDVSQVRADSGLNVTMDRAAQPIRMADGTVFQQNPDGSRTWIYPESSPVARVDILAGADGSIINGHWLYRSGPTREVTKQGNHFIWDYFPSSDPRALARAEKFDDGSMKSLYRDGTKIEQWNDAVHTKLFSYPNGKVFLIKDNYQSFTYPPGTAPQGFEAFKQIEIFEGGKKVVWTKTDGSTIVRNPDGTFTYPPAVAPINANNGIPGRDGRTGQVQPGADNPMGLQFQPLQDGGRIGINQQGKIAFVDNGRGVTASYQYDQSGKITRVKSTDGSVWAIQGVDPNGNDLWINNRNQRWVGRLPGVNARGYAQYYPANGPHFEMSPNGQPQVSMTA